MRIAFLTTQINLKTGGGSNLSPHLKALSMAELGHEVSILTLFPERNSSEGNLPYKVVPIPTRFKNWMALQIKIFFVLKKYEKDFDIFAFEGEHFIWGAGLYRKLGGKIPVMLHLNGPIFSIYEHGATYNAKDLPAKTARAKSSSWLRKFFEKNIGVKWANNIDQFTADSPLIKKWHEEFGFDSKKIIVLPAFVDLSIFKNSVSTWEPSSQVSEQVKILYVGRLVPEKGVDTLIEAMKNLKDKNIRTDIVGRGPEEKNLKLLTTNYKLQTKITFHPWSDKKTLNDLYHSADIFVHPARWAEPLGLTVIEAMAAGLPVIVPEVSGSAWAAGEGGLTFKNGDAEDLKDKIGKLVENKELRDDLGKKALEQSRKFDYRNSVKLLEKLFRGIIGKK